jgi:hypothetical protein
LLLFASTGVKCQFARKNGRAVYLRKRCAKGWKYSRRKPNPAGICMRRGRFYFAQPYT